MVGRPLWSMQAAWSANFAKSAESSHPIIDVPLNTIDRATLFDSKGLRRFQHRQFRRTGEPTRSLGSHRRRGLHEAIVYDKAGSWCSDPNTDFGERTTLLPLPTYFIRFQSRLCDLHQYVLYRDDSLTTALAGSTFCRLYHMSWASSQISKRNPPGPPSTRSCPGFLPYYRLFFGTIVSASAADLATATILARLR